MPSIVDGAGAADAVLAADMRAGRAELVAQEIGQQHARLGLAFDGAAVEREADADGAAPAFRRVIAATSSIRSRPIGGRGRGDSARSHGRRRGRRVRRRRR